MIAFCSAYLTPPSHHTSPHDTVAIRRRSTLHRSYFSAARDASHLGQRRGSLRTTTPLSSSVLDSETNESPFKAANETQQQTTEFKRVLSSPELFDATIGITEVIESAAIAAQVDVASLEDAVQINDLNKLTPKVSSCEEGGCNDDDNVNNTQQNDFSISHDDDLDLTRQIIMQHIEKIGQGDEGVLHWILDDDDDDDKEDAEQQGENMLTATQEAASASTTSAAVVSDVKTTTPSSRNIMREINTPSVAKILKYTIPAIGVWLCSPVLSMIDTASVGLLSGTAQQAALNPAVSVTDTGALVVAFMYTATTNLIAAAQAQDQDDGEGIDAPRTTLTLITALKLALVVGSVFGVTLSFFGNTLIQSLIGNESLDPAVVSAALRYVRIRCLGMPAAVFIGTAQSACLGMQDVKSPLYVLLAAAVINFCGDMLLVPNSNLWLGGAAGAAWATVFSQYGALIMFWKWMTTRPKEGVHEGKRLKFDWSALSTLFGGKKIRKEGESKRVNITQGIMELTGTSAEGQPRRNRFREFLTSNDILKGIRQSRFEFLIRSREKRPAAVKSSPKSRGFLADGKLKFREYLSFSNTDVPTAKEFLPFVIPVTTTSIGRISGYIAMVSIRICELCGACCIVFSLYSLTFLLSFKLHSHTSHQAHLENLIWLHIKLCSVSSVV